MFTFFHHNLWIWLIVLVLASFCFVLLKGALLLGALGQRTRFDKILSVFFGIDLLVILCSLIATILGAIGNAISW